MIDSDISHRSALLSTRPCHVWPSNRPLICDCRRLGIEPVRPYVAFSQVGATNRGTQGDRCSRPHATWSGRVLSAEDGVYKLGLLFRSSDAVVPFCSKDLGASVFRKESV